MPPCAGPEHLPVRPEHVAETNVHGLGPRGQPTGQAGGGKDHLEVLGLGQADDVHDQVGPQALDAVADRGQVGGGVVVTADGVLHDERQWFSLAVGKPGGEDTKGALALDQ